MRLSLIAEIFNMLLMTVILGVAVYLLVLIVKALKKYISFKEIREEKSAIQRSLGEELKAQRLRCKMTQEFVADALGVSRQAVSKWENGTVDPSTSNLLALAKLYGISAEELLRNVGHSKDGED